MLPQQRTLPFDVIAHAWLYPAETATASVNHFARLPHQLAHIAARICRPGKDESGGISIS